MDGRWDSDTDAARTAFRRALGLTLSRARRKLTAYTQETIADELGVDTETVGRWERGEREPKTFELHRLAVKYDVPGDWLMFPSDRLSEIDERIARLRAERLATAAVVAAQAAPAAERRPRGGVGRAPSRDRRTA